MRQWHRYGPALRNLFKRARGVPLMNRVRGLQISPPFSQFLTEIRQITIPVNSIAFPLCPSVACQRFRTTNHLVALGNDIFDHDTKIRVSVERRRQILLRTIRARLGVALGVRSVLNVVRSDVAIGGIKVFLIYEFLEMPAYKCLPVLDLHNRVESRCF